MEYNSNYRGIVLDNTGPYGQCKIYIPSIYPSKIDELNFDQEGFQHRLPWAQPATPIFGGCSDNQGMCSVPKLNSHVWVFFEEGDISSPVYFASIQSNKAWVIPDDNKEDHHVIKTPGRITIQASEINLQSPSINMNAPGKNIKKDSGVTKIKDPSQAGTQGTRTAENFVPHAMYDPNTEPFKEYFAETYEDHVQYASLGYVHLEDLPSKRVQEYATRRAEEITVKRPSSELYTKNPISEAEKTRQQQEFDAMMRGEDTQSITEEEYNAIIQQGESGGTGSGGGSGGGGSGGGSGGGGGGY